RGRITLAPAWSLSVLALTLLPVAAPAAEMAVVSGRYLGDGTSPRAITGLPFKPDLLIIKGASRAASIARTSTMSGDHAKELGLATRFQTNAIRSLDAAGFTVGSDATANQPGVTYEWVAFQAAAGRMALGSFNGNAADNRKITVGFQPEYVMLVSDQTR